MNCLTNIDKLSSRLWAFGMIVDRRKLGERDEKREKRHKLKKKMKKEGEQKKRRKRQKNGRKREKSINIYNWRLNCYRIIKYDNRNENETASICKSSLTSFRSSNRMTNWLNWYWIYYVTFCVWIIVLKKKNPLLITELWATCSIR